MLEIISKQEVKNILRKTIFKYKLIEKIVITKSCYNKLKIVTFQMFHKKVYFRKVYIIIFFKCSIKTLTYEKLPGLPETEILEICILLRLPRHCPRVRAEENREDGHRHRHRQVEGEAKILKTFHFRQIKFQSSTF